MPVNHEKKCAFIHIPKNAGSSIEYSIDIWNRNDSCAIRKEKFYGHISSLDKCRYRLKEVDWQHITAFQMKSLLGLKLWQNYFTFAVVRNPWDRMVSWYHYLNSETEFSKWILSPDIGLRKHIPLKRILRPQSDYITDNTGQIIVDKVIRFEQFRRDFKEVCAILDLRIGSFPHVRKAIRKPYKEYYNTTESIASVRNMFAKDINRFEYEF